jgi:hypothetical protein
MSVRLQPREAVPFTRDDAGHVARSVVIATQIATFDAFTVLDERVERVETEHALSGKEVAGSALGDSEGRACFTSQ